MKLLINCSNLKIGGGLQVAHSFIHECKKFEDNQYFITLSPVMQKIIKVDEYPSNFNFLQLNKDISKFKNNIDISKKLNKYLQKIKPDHVFSVFGPTYWSPGVTHTQGFANGWSIYPKSVAYKRLSRFVRIKKKLENFIKIQELKKNGDYYIVESETVKKKMNNLHKIPFEKIFVVNNTFNSIFQNAYKKNLMDDKIRILTIAANYPHKNLNIISKVVDSLLKRNFKNFEFILTISNSDYSKMFNEKYIRYIKTKGPVKITECPDLYNKVNIMFLPTLLECFSASYPEAMIMQTPIITSNLDFAKEICRDAAIYIDPLSPENIAQSIIDLSKNKVKQNLLIQKGLERVKMFPSAESRAEKYLEIFQNINLIKKNS